jgi:hypothetical protein
MLAALEKFTGQLALLTQLWDCPKNKVKPVSVAGFIFSFTFW